VRGKQRKAYWLAVGSRSIPACAGETSLVVDYTHFWRVYPRVCGGNPKWRKYMCINNGLSPRVRGKHFILCCHIPSLGSIPACAGETVSQSKIRLPQGVYPRVCGGNLVRLDGISDVDGLSPRVRGKPALLDYKTKKHRSIPACAGETQNAVSICVSITVYPRVCGGNIWHYAKLSDGPGLSPRVRGKPLANALKARY